MVWLTLAEHHHDKHRTHLAIYRVIMVGYRALLEIMSVFLRNVLHNSCVQYAIILSERTLAESQITTCSFGKTTITTKIATAGTTRLRRSVRRIGADGFRPGYWCWSCYWHCLARRGCLGASPLTPEVAYSVVFEQVRQEMVALLDFPG